MQVGWEIACTCVLVCSYTCLCTIIRVCTGHFAHAGVAAPVCPTTARIQLSGHGHGKGCVVLYCAVPHGRAKWEEEEASQRKPHPSSSSHPSPLYS